MKIRRIKWKSHPILNNLELDFLNNEGHPFQTIIIAGENGVGKTTILENISNYLILNTYDNNIEYIEYEYNNELFSINFFPLKNQYNSQEQFKLFYYNSGRWNEITNGAKFNEINPNQFGCVISKARANYHTNQITSIQFPELDKLNKNRDDSEDFTPLKQLLVDIDSKDKSDYYDLNKTDFTNTKTVQDFYPSSGSYRFKKAFDNFFEYMKYKGIKDNSSWKEVQFEKDDKMISLDTLSTGEKQVVFRGTYLLQNSKKLPNSIVLIDEPELSMHPKWQRKVIKYYKDLVSDNSFQLAQLIVTTHSEQVIKEALNKKADDLVIILTSVIGEIQAKKVTEPTVLPCVTSAEANYLAFDIASNDYHIELYSYIQDHNNLGQVKNCDKYIVNHNLYNPSKHKKQSKFINQSNSKTINYESLPTYIRNAIHHPDNGNKFTEEELRTSIELMVEICKSF